MRRWAGSYFWLSCSYHNWVVVIKLIFLPCNTKSEVQSVNQNVAQNLEMVYCRSFVKHYIPSMDQGTSSRFWILSFYVALCRNIFHQNALRILTYIRGILIEPIKKMILLLTHLQGNLTKILWGSKLSFYCRLLPNEEVR